MASTSPVPLFSQVSLKSLRLRPGMFLQSQRMEKNSPTYEAQFLGLIQDKCLMVVPVGTFSIKNGMKAGESFVIRGFTGQFDFHFTSTVIQAFDFTFREPAFAYAVLSFPEVVDARKVRNSMRIKTSIPAGATPHGSDASIPVTMVDLSVDGALVHSKEPLGTTGELVSLDFSMGTDLDLAYLVALARICHFNQANGEEALLTGLLFENLSAADRLTLKDFVLSNLD